jgi:hypothetical protein
MDCLSFALQCVVIQEVNKRLRVCHVLCIKLFYLFKPLIPELNAEDQNLMGAA